MGKPGNRWFRSLSQLSAREIHLGKSVTEARFLDYDLDWFVLGAGVFFSQPPVKLILDNDADRTNVPCWRGTVASSVSTRWQLIRIIATRQLPDFPVAKSALCPFSV
jgi:hypothetical protein